MEEEDDGGGLMKTGENVNVDKVLFGSGSGSLHIREPRS